MNSEKAQQPELPLSSDSKSTLRYKITGDRLVTQWRFYKAQVVVYQDMVEAKEHVLRARHEAQVTKLQEKQRAESDKLSAKLQALRDRSTLMERKSKKALADLAKHDPKRAGIVVFEDIPGFVPPTQEGT